MPDGEFGAYFRDSDCEELAEKGPCLEVGITLPGGDKGIRLWAVIDTGASACAVNKTLLEQLGSKAVGMGKIQSVNSTETCEIHKIQIHFFGSDLVLNDWMVCATPPPAHPLILGRDFLKNTVFVYDGGGNIIILMLPENILKASVQEKYTLVSEAILKGFQGIYALKRREQPYPCGQESRFTDNQGS